VCVDVASLLCSVRARVKCEEAANILDRIYSPTYTRQAHAQKCFNNLEVATELMIMQPTMQSSINARASEHYWTCAEASRRLSVL